VTEPYVRPDVRLFLDYLNNLPGPKTYEVGAVEARRMILASRFVADAPTGALELIRDLSCPGPAGDIPLRLCDARAERPEPGPLMVYFHGGGFVFGDLDTHEPICAELARRLDMPVLSVDYRLAPEHPWPAGVEDAIAATRWAAGNPAALERKVTGLVLAGDSAGGNFAIVTALALRDEAAAVPVLAQWPIYPASDPGTTHPSRADFGAGYMLTRPSMDWFEECYCGDERDWRYAPLMKSQAGMPPTLVTTASLDPIRDQGRAYAAACVAAGVPTIFIEAEGNVHGFVNLRRAIPSTDGDIDRSVAALKLLLAGGGR
jgi:acetyl esterase